MTIARRDIMTSRRQGRTRFLNKAYGSAMRRHNIRAAPGWQPDRIVGQPER
jgi:hypothetical protein